MAGKFVTSGDKWQPGAPSWYQGWDGGASGWPAAGSSGTNRPGDGTNKRATMQFICIHENQPDLEKTHEQHFERFLFRVMDENDEVKLILDEWNNNLRKIRDANAGYKSIYPGGAKNKSLPGGFPVCHMYTYQQVNYILAKYAYTTNESFTRQQVYNSVKPLGISVTPPATSKLTQGVMDDVRVLVVSGPQHVANEFGANLRENDNCYAVFEPIKFTGASIDFRLGPDNKVTTLAAHPLATKIADRTVTSTDKFPTHYWQIRMVASDSMPVSPVLVLDDFTEVVGFSMCIGKVQFIFVETNNSIGATFGYDSVTSGSRLIPKYRDSAASDKYPTVKMFVDYTTAGLRNC
jgi:hypothetical protein